MSSDQFMRCSHVGERVGARPNKVLLQEKGDLFEHFPRDIQNTRHLDEAVNHSRDRMRNDIDPRLAEALRIEHSFAVKWIPISNSKECGRNPA